MLLSTRHKIACARVASDVVCGARRLAGLGPVVQTRRGGILWNLDLREGFEFSIFLLGGIEPDTQAACRRLVKEGDVVLDIGANLGAHTLPLAKLAGATGCVHAFEASDDAFRRLRTNIDLNPDLEKRITTHQILLAADSAAAKPDGIPSSWPLHAGGGDRLHPVHLGCYHSVSGAVVMSLDEWAARVQLEKIDFIKLDVDGYEIDVLEGAASLMARHRPLLLMEFMPYVYPERGTTFARLLEVLSGFGYAAESLRGEPLELVAELAQRIPSGGSMNVLLRPGDRV